MSRALHYFVGGTTVLASVQRMSTTSRSSINSARLSRCELRLPENNTVICLFGRGDFDLERTLSFLVRDFFLDS